MELQNMIDLFTEKRKDKISALTKSEDKLIFKTALKYFEDIKEWGDIHPNTLDEIFEQISKDYTNDKRNRVKKKMQQLFDFIIRGRHVDFTHNPFKQVAIAAVPKSEKRAKLFFESFSDVPQEHHTITRLYSVAKTPQERLLILLCTITGGRINEVLNLRWEDINVSNREEPFLKIKNSKIKPTDQDTDQYRLMDINPLYLDKIMMQKFVIDQKFKKLKAEYLFSGLTKNRQYFESDVTTKASTGHSDRRAHMKWKWVITTELGDKPSYTTVREWYIRMWHDAYDKYINHKEYPFPHKRDCELTFHAFRRHYICAYRDSLGDDFTKAHHERLQQLVGHKIGSPVTDDVYTQWTNSKVVKTKMNSKINLGVSF